LLDTSNLNSLGWRIALLLSAKETLLAYRSGTAQAHSNKPCIGKEFLSRTPATQQLRERMDKWDYIKLKGFCTTREMVSKLKRPPTE
jgi:hypothetical protein